MYRWNDVIESLVASETDSLLASSGMSRTFAQFGRSGCSICSRSTAGRQTLAWLVQDVSTKREAVGSRGPRSAPRREDPGTAGAPALPGSQ